MQVFVHVSSVCLLAKVMIHATLQDDITPEFNISDPRHYRYTINIRKSHPHIVLQLFPLVFQLLKVGHCI